MDTLGNCEVIRNGDSLPDMMFKLIVIGEASVGKSCMLMRAVKDQYNDNYEVTVGADSSNFIVKIKDSFVQLQVWDTAGMEKFRSVIKVFFTGANGAFLVYDITRKETFDALGTWLTMLRDSATPDIKIVLVGNKKDNVEGRKVSYEMGKQYMEQNELFDFVETSAKTGEGVIDSFIKIAKALYLDHEHVPQATKDATTSLEKVKEKKKGCC